MKRARGRPSKYTPKLAAAICERLAAGEPLRSICRDDGMPAWRTVYDWIDQDIDGLSTRIARARIAGFDALAEQCLEIADDEQHDWVLTKKGPVLNEVAIGRAKLQVDTRLKLLAKWDPKRYGDKTSMELTGADGGPVQISDTERAAKIAAILAAAQARRDGDVSDLV